MLSSRLAALALFLAAAVAVPAQTVTPRGEDGTFEVATWNVEFFGQPSQGPSNDALQLSNVAAIIGQSDIDLWALQEVVDEAEWSELLVQLQSAGYGGRLGPQVSSTPQFDQKLAFVYDRSVIQVIRTRSILESESFAFAGRVPWEMQARVTIGGVSRTIYIITFHAKASTGLDDYNRRADAAAALKTYIDDRIARGEEVILLGDFNDYLTGSTRTGQLSPYKALVDDADYVPASLALEDAGINTFCSPSNSSNASCTSGDTRDHLLFTASLSDVFVEVDRYSEVLSDVSGYVSTTSDHVPVLARFAFRSVACDGCGPRPAVELLPAVPNPFPGTTDLRFSLDAPADVQLDVFDAVGRRVATASGAYGIGEHRVALDGAGLAPGAYVVRLAAGAVVQSRVIVRAR